MPLLLKGNAKLGKNIYHFALPAKKTCTPSEWCKKNCYACKGLYVTYRDVIGQCHERNYQASLQDDFVPNMIKEINRTKTPIRYVRIHSSGDFYSHEYINKWIQIVEACPNTKFLAFTKRTDLLDSLIKLSELDNVNILESLDPSLKGPKTPFFTARIVEPNKVQLGHLCEGSCSDCLYCFEHRGSVKFYPH